ncbi:MAG: hypothetical protein K2X03_07685 [Bryobacteraceae bacterium]|nr:hypothetical protein [Bryobacteraceae bacterium]
MLTSLLVMGAFLAPVANADESNKKTVITFSGPVEIPGVHVAGWGVLPAGTYVFKIMDSQSDRHIVQIFNKEETTIYATILAIPNYRLKATDKTVMTFSERPAGQPEALRAWFYPGRNSGEEFVYPKSRAMELAKASNVPVLYTPAELPAEMAEPITSADVPVVLEMKRAQIMAIRPTGEDARLADVVEAPPADVETPAAAAPAAPAAQPATPSPAPAAEADTLPNTASWLPLLAVLGLLALGGAAALRAVERHLS